MALDLTPLPTKTRVSFDIPKLIDALKSNKEFYTDASFEDLLVIRSYITRNALPYRLSQTKLHPTGYKLTLKYL